MELEKKLANYVVDARYEDIPKDVINIAKNIMLDIVGATVSGSTSEGCDELLELIKGWGGKEEATILIHGGLVPACNAVLINSYMARSADYENAHPGGAHFGASCIPVALASAEMRGGINGRDFLTAVVVGSDVGYRINAATQYDGLDPTGYATVFSATAIAGKILGLSKEQMLDALGIAFNKVSGSFQNNIDGSLCVRLIQGYTSQTGIISAILAQKGFNGARNFIEGEYGYFHLYSRSSEYDADILVSELGKRYEILNTYFKLYPGCGATQVSTEIALAITQEYGVKPNDVAEIIVKVGPFVHKLVGHPFQLGDRPRVNAQFSIRYCVANALTRGTPKLQHFNEDAVRELVKSGFINKINVERNEEAVGPAAGRVEMVISTKNGKKYKKTQDMPRGTVETPLTREEHLERYWQCIKYAGSFLPKGKAERVITVIDKLDEISNVCSIIPLLVA